MSGERTLAQVTTALPSREEAEAMAAGVVAERLAACAQVSGPVVSHFVWKGRTCREEEWLCVMKTPVPHVARLIERVRATHPYEVPEVIAVPVTQALEAYLDWAAGSVGEP